MSVSENGTTNIKPATNLDEFHTDEGVIYDEDTSCGIGIIRGRFLQRFANKKAYVFLYGMLGCLFSATFAYHNGIITTLEKRFKIPSRNSGIITIGNDISTLFVSVVVSYYTGRRHRPRWMGLGLYTVVLYCLLTAFPHILYGPGEDALQLTQEFGTDATSSLSNISSYRRELCEDSSSNISSTWLNSCGGGSYAPQVILFVAQFIAGIGAPLYYTLGVSYLDDNVKRSKTPALVSYSYFLRMLGPCIGYTLASFCLRIYISPSLTPTIGNDDPRWLGAWWLGWLILGSLIMIFGSLLALFPKTLPRAAARKLQRQLNTSEVEHELPTSFKDMMITFKRTVTNPILMTNNLAAIFYFIGYMPYWIFLPKYIETQYKRSASASNLITGTVGLAFSAIGVLLSGVVISRSRPKARKLAAWNVLVGVVSVCGILSYAYLGCTENENQILIGPSGEIEATTSCNRNCKCDEGVKYSPVCSYDGKTSFLSACHAGCHRQSFINGTKYFVECSCIQESSYKHVSAGYATQGNCYIDCTSKFYIFLVVVCILKFTGATGKASNYLVTVRCVPEKDKSVAMGFTLTMMSLFAFVPSPIFFGMIIDKTCLLWGHTCDGKGNCWLYNGATLRHTMNFTAAAFVAIGTFFDVIVWYLVRDLQIFDEDIIPNPSKNVPEETTITNLNI